MGDPRVARRRFQPIIIALLLVVGSTGLASADDLNPQRPGGGGVVLDRWTSTPFVVDTARVTVALDKPTSWNVTVVENSVLVQPSPNPYDLGVLLVITPVDPSFDPASQVATLFPGAASGDTEPVTFGGESTTLTYWNVSFADGRGARVMTVARSTDQYHVLCMFGGSDEGFAPWEGSLRRILESVTVESL